MTSSIRTGRLLEAASEIAHLLRRCRTIAVLGIKPETHRDRAAFFVPEYLVEAGFHVIPVPVYFPAVESILGKKVVRSLAEISVPVDLVDVFRRSEDLMMHVEDLLAKRPAAVWLQSGIRHDEFARILMREGIDVVQDRCLMIDHQQLM